MSSERPLNPSCPEPEFPDPLDYAIKALGLPEDVRLAFLEKIYKVLKTFSPSSITKVETVQFSMGGWQIYAAVGGRMEGGTFLMTVGEVDAFCTDE